MDQSFNYTLRDISRTRECLMGSGPYLQSNVRSSIIRQAPSAAEPRACRIGLFVPEVNAGGEYRLKGRFADLRASQPRTPAFPKT